MNRDRVPHDNDRYPWGKNRGIKFKNVPLSYWEWLVGAELADHWPGILKYAMRRLNITERPKELDPLRPHNKQRRTGPAQPPSPWITGRNYRPTGSNDCPFDVPVQRRRISRSEE